VYEVFFLSINNVHSTEETTFTYLINSDCQDFYRPWLQ